MRLRGNLISALENLSCIALKRLASVLFMEEESINQYSPVCESYIRINSRFLLRRSRGGVCLFGDLGVDH